MGEHIIKMYLGGNRGLDSLGSGLRPVAGCCVHGNELLGFIKGGDFLGQLRDC
jgi:hypothetical protein